MTKNFQFSIFNFQTRIFFFSFVLFLLPTLAWGYPIDNGVDEASRLGFSLNEFAKSLFGSKLILPEARGLDISNLVTGSDILSFDDFVNTKSFSTKDIPGSIKAVGILFIKLVILSLSIALAIFKMLLGLVVNNF